MRGLIKGISTLFVLSLVLSFLHSCSLDNGILKPSCLVFEIDLDEKWWYPQEKTDHAIYFHSNGRVSIEGVSDSITFRIENCNKIAATNYTASTLEQWVIKRITDEELNLQYPDGNLVMYSRTR